MRSEIQLETVLPQRFSDSHKGTYGRALIIAGSPGMAGAAYLAGMTAYRSGCGLVELFSHDCNRIVLQELLPEAVISTYAGTDDAQPPFERADAVGIGCGIGLGDMAESLVEQTCRYVHDHDVPAVFDADALTILGRREDLLTLLADRKVILTPHPKEMASLTHTTVKNVQDDRVRTVTDFAGRFKVTCLLKGHRTLVSSPGARLYENHTGNDGMATGGSGDVLTGLIAGLLAQGCSPPGAAQAGAYLHGAGGDRAALSVGRRSLLARDLIEGIIRCLKEFDESKQDGI